MDGYGEFFFNDGRTYKGDIFKIKNMEKEYLPGHVEENMMECGKMVNNMEKLYILL